MSRLDYLAPTHDLAQAVSSVNSYYTTILEYLVVRDINIISVKLRCLHPGFSLVTLVRGVGASCPGWFITPPPAQDLGRSVSSVNSYCTIILEYLVVRDINIISVKLRCLHPRFSLVTLMQCVGGKLSRLVYLATPAQDLGQAVSSVQDQDQDQDQDSLLMKRRNDNHSPGPVIRELVPSSHQRSELSNTILCIFSG